MVINITTYHTISCEIFISTEKEQDFFQAGVARLMQHITYCQAAKEMSLGVHQL